VTGRRERCKALYAEDGKWYDAKIDSAEELAGYTVTWLDFGTSSVIPDESSLKPYEPAPVERLVPGQAVKAFHEGLFHMATVSGPGSTPETVLLKFSKYKKKREVALYDVVLRGDEVRVAGAAAHGSGASEKKGADGPLPARAVIPENLTIKPTDTEAQKKVKQKKIKRLKSTHHKKKLEEEGKKVQSAWQQFQKGSSLLKKRKSIFASPDDVDGKVGVTGSGKNMTTFSDRIKYAKTMKLATGEAAPPPLLD